MSCDPEGALSWEKLLGLGWHWRKHNHRIQHPALPLQVATTEPPGLHPALTHAHSDGGTRAKGLALLPSRAEQRGQFYLIPSSSFPWAGAGADSAFTHRRSQSLKRGK